jgi:DnaK suppressor protein
VSKPKAKAAAVKKAPAKSAKSAKPVNKPITKPVSKSVSKALSPAPKKPAHKSVSVPTPSKKPAATHKAMQAKKSPPAAKPKTPAKTPAKAAAKADTKASAKPELKAAGKSASPTPSKAAAAPQATAPPPAAAPVKTKIMTSTPTDIKPAAKPVKTGGKISAAKAAQLAVAPASPPSNRFTDRFAPARPHVRQMAELAETPKINYRADPKLAAAWKTKTGRDLSEPELHAMPESEYMNDKQLDFFRARLQKQRDDLLSNAGETTEHLREDTSIVPDPADRATIEEEHALELRTRDRERKLLKKIAQSLTRLDSGDYGFCDETGEPIGLARLIARPTATLSLEAQQRRELKQKMFGD